MSDVKISELPLATELDGSEETVVVQGGETRRAQVSGTSVLHQLDDRSWSAAVPERDPDDPRVELRGWDDPEDETNGVTGRENITDLDVWLDLNEFGIAPPWGS